MEYGNLQASPANLYEYNGVLIDKLTCSPEINNNIIAIRIECRHVSKLT